MTAEGVVDRFVTAIRHAGVLVEAIQSAPWVSAFEQGLPRRFSASYAALVYRYQFPAFERGGIALFGNLGNGSDDDLVIAAVADQFLSRPALSGGLLQIGRLDTGSYDPVCLDSRGMKNRREYPLVLLDHEELLQFERIAVLQKLHDSFLSFMLGNGAAP